MAVLPNIVYERINFRIGIYEAWNRGVELARGRYLTNTNLDDQRRTDSLALQAEMLDRYPGVDVVYQDFFYSFDADLDFDDVARFGYQSQIADRVPTQPARLQLTPQRADVAPLPSRRIRPLRHELPLRR